MEDWTPLAEAVHKHGGQLFGGVDAVARRIRDGILELRADLVVDWSEPEFQPSSPDLPPGSRGTNDIAPIHLPVSGQRRATVRTEEREVLLPTEIGELLSRVPPQHPLWHTGEFDVSPDGIRRTTAYGLRVRTVAVGRDPSNPDQTIVEPETDRICRLMAKWIESERAAGRRASYTGAAERFADQFPDCRDEGGAERGKKRLTRRFPTLYPDLARPAEKDKQGQGKSAG